MKATAKTEPALERALREWLGLRRTCALCFNAEDAERGAEVAEKIMLGDAAADGRRDDAELGHELRELIFVERLRAVAERVVGIVVHLDE